MTATAGPCAHVILLLFLFECSTCGKDGIGCSRSSLEKRTERKKESTEGGGRKAVLWAVREEG